MTHRRDIEGLRAVAVAAVLLFHFGVPGTAGGYVGVDVFFVVSGFLITSLLVAERESTGRVSIGAFYSRRIRRLLPISATVLAVTAGASLIWLSPTRLDDLVAEMRAAALFGANILFAERGTDYLTADLSPSPLQHYWSLGVEEQFYVLWPVLVAAATLGARNVRARLFVLVAGVAGASLTASIALSPHQPSWSWYGPHTRAWELAAGAGLALVVRTGAPRRAGRLRSSGAWIGLIAMVACVPTFGAVSVFPGWAAIVPVAATLLVLAGGDDAPGGATRLLALRPLQYLGSRSYSLYLWHWPALVIAEARAGRDLGVAAKLVILALVIVVAEAGHRLIENPARRSPFLVANTGWSMATGASLVASGLLAAALVGTHDPRLDTGYTAGLPATVTTAPAAATSSTLDDPGPVLIDTTGETAPEAVVAALDVDLLPDDLRPSLRSARFDLPGIYGDECHRFESSAPRPGCIFGDTGSEFTVALWGDSHAAQWFTPLERIARRRGWRLLSVTQGSCSFLDVVTYNSAQRTEFRRCEPWRTKVRELMRAEGVDAVLMSQFYGLREASTTERITPERWRQLLPPLLESLRADGIEPILLADTPNPADPVPDCLSRNPRRISACVTRAEDRWSGRIDAVLSELAKSAAVGLVEPSRWLCHRGSCPAVVGNLLVYRDENHVSDAAMAWLTPLIEGVIGPPLDARR